MPFPPHPKFYYDWYVLKSWLPPAIREEIEAKLRDRAESNGVLVKFDLYPEEGLSEAALEALLPLGSGKVLAIHYSY